MPVVEEVALDSATGVPPLILPVVEELVDDSPAAELFGEKPPAPESGVPPPPGFLPFLFPENDGGMDADDICARFGGITSLTLSPISRESSDTPHASDGLLLNHPDTSLSRDQTVTAVVHQQRDVVLCALLHRSVHQK